MTTWLLALAGGYLLLVAAVYFYQPHLLFLPALPSRELTRTPADIDLVYEAVHLSTRDGVRLHGWWVGHPQPRGTILFFHGNAGNISHRLQTLRLFHELGYRSLIIDYRGYGQSGGKPSEQGLYADAEAAWRYLRQDRQLSSGEIVLSGRSLGAAVALYLAEQHRPRALIMESAFTSIPDMAAVHYGWLPVRWLSRYQFDNRQRIVRLDCPVLFVHATEDAIAPYEQGRELYQLASQPKQWLALNGGHNDAQLNDYQTYTRGLQAFLVRH
ncbi:alpha/beta hydrolase [Thiohalophilus sp.]|uniref:alpha/beta hydrolase n=1 Tax=Thiohalophilus sp. TaxID=3028392 RepID=UPI002ACE9199|nr:alpha/beta hydrolase [Thiohalophilus sp.]MDZ7661165.1 alpha/beta hydrolase [Thiohalophilus sp.]